MPILAPAFPVLTIESLPDTSQQDTRTLAFRSLAGEYPFPSTGTEFFFMPDIEGLDKPPLEVITKPMPGMDGEELSEIRTGKREVFLPLWMRGLTHSQYLDRRDQLAGLFNHRLVDYRRSGGTFDLVATSMRGERSLRCVYVDGMTNAKWPNEGKVWAKLGIALWACNPYWQGERWTTPLIQQPAGADFFASFPPELSSSRALGPNIPVTIAGDVESWITVDLVGPSSAVTIDGGGVLVSIPAGLADGETAQIVTDPSRRQRTALFDGIKDWARVGPATTWKPLFPGERLLSITMAGANANTRAVVSGPTGYERPW